MSYIVPRDKPHYCIDCIFLDRNYRDCKLQKIDYCDFNKQYKNCPLIDIPTPHGRLGDLDKLKAKFRHSEKDDEVDKVWNSVVRRIITQADTIIEAEE